MFIPGTFIKHSNTPQPTWDTSPAVNSTLITPAQISHLCYMVYSTVTVVQDVPSVEGNHSSFLKNCIFAQVVFLRINCILQLRLISCLCLHIEKSSHAAQLTTSCKINTQDSKNGCFMSSMLPLMLSLSGLPINLQNSVSSLSGIQIYTHMRISEA